MSTKRSTQASGFVQGVKKFFLSSFVIFTFLAYLIHERHLNSTIASVNNGDPNSNSATTLTVPSNAPTSTLQSQAGIYKNGTYTGPTINVFYGLVQVQVVIQNGQISDVQFLQYPNDRRTSQMINRQAMPWLTQEAIQAQSGNVNLISGATLTSEGFVNSLQAALQSATN